MPLAFELFDFDGLDGLIEDSETVLMIYLAAIAILIGFAVVNAAAERIRTRSPVEKILRRKRAF